MWNPFKRKQVEELRGAGASSEITQTPSYRFDSMPTLQGLSDFVHTERAMRFTAVFCAMRLRAEAIASLPKSVRIQTSKGYEEATDHPVFQLLRFEPNGYMNVFNFWEYLNTCLDGWGNSYTLIVRENNGTPKVLIPIHPRTVTVTLKSGRKWYRVAGSVDSDGIYPDDDILHFFSMSTDGIRGVNPILYNSDAIQSGLSATTFGNSFFASGGDLKGVYETENKMSADDYKRIFKELSELPPGSTPILENGLKYKTVGIQPEAAQMLQTRTFAIQDIARIFNIPPHMLGDLSRATFSNIEHQDIQYVKHSIRPCVKRFESEIDRKLFFTSERGKYQVKFNLEGMLRGDSKTRNENYQKAILSGWMSRNEVRKVEGLNWVEGLDEFIYPSNMLLNGSDNNNSDGKKE